MATTCGLKRSQFFSPLLQKYRRQPHYICQSPADRPGPGLTQRRRVTRSQPSRMPAALLEPVLRQAIPRIFHDGRPLISDATSRSKAEAAPFKSPMVSRQGLRALAGCFHRNPAPAGGGGMEGLHDLDNMKGEAAIGARIVFTLNEARAISGQTDPPAKNDRYESTEPASARRFCDSRAGPSPSKRLGSGHGERSFRSMDFNPWKMVGPNIKSSWSQRRGRRQRTPRCP